MTAVNDWPGLRLFPDNYVWHLSTNIAVNTGGQVAEIVQICQGLQEVSRQGDEGAEAFCLAWTEAADALVTRADGARSAGHDLTAGDLLLRAAVYYLTAERMQSLASETRRATYRKGLDAFARGIEHARKNCERVEVPYGETQLPALFVRAEGMTGHAPAMVLFNGLDSTKEMVYGSGLPQELARRGYSSIIVDHPGSGEALRLRDLKGSETSEVWAAAAIDYLETRPDVDPDRIGIGAWSLGGYYAPRAAAFEKRFKVCVAWGANPHWGDLQKKRLAREGDRPVPHYWEHVQWVFGHGSVEEFMAWTPAMTLENVAEQITIPILIMHGADDTQIPLEHAHWMYEHSTGSPAPTLKVFERSEGGTLHCSADNVAVAASFISDWVADVL